MQYVAVGYYRTLASQSSASLSAGYLASHLRHLGLNVTIHQLDRGKDASDMAPILQQTPDLILLKPNFQDIDRLPGNIAACSDHGIPVGLFGPFATLNARDLLTAFSTIRGVVLPNHDYLIGPQIGWWLGNQHTTEEPLGVIFQDPQRGIVENTDLPEAIERNCYAVLPARDVEETEPIFIVNLESSRGCVRGCSFCHIPSVGAVSGVPILRRQVEDVVEEMRSLRDLGKRYFIFNDSIMGGGGSTKTLEWLDNFAARIANEADTYHFMGYFTQDLLDRNRPLIETLARVGLIRVFVGIEAASAGSLRIFNKNVEYARYAALKTWLAAQYIVPHIGFMLFHPFATPDDVVCGLDFLRASEELHRFAVVKEPARLVPQTALMTAAATSGLLQARLTGRTPHPYRYAHAQTELIRERMESIWNRIGITVLERIEHLFTTGIFIDNLVRRHGLSNDRFQAAMANFDQQRQRFSSVYHRLLMGQVGPTNPSPPTGLRFSEMLAELEEQWSELIHGAEAAGLESPLKWITTGDLRSEALRPAGYNGHWPTTRSGTLASGGEISIGQRH